MCIKNQSQHGRLSVALQVFCYSAVFCLFFCVSPLLVCGKITIRLRLKQVSIQQLKNTNSSPQWLNQQSHSFHHLSLGLFRCSDAFRLSILLFLRLMSCGILLFSGVGGLDVVHIILACSFDLSVLFLGRLGLKGRLRVLLQQRDHLLLGLLS